MSGVLVGGVINGIGVLVGGVITWLVSRIYYQKAGQELREEAGKVRKKVDMVLHGFEVAGLANLKRDANGEITGFDIVLNAEGGHYRMT